MFQLRSRIWQGAILFVGIGLVAFTVLAVPSGSAHAQSVTCSVSDSSISLGSSVTVAVSAINTGTSTIIYATSEGDVLFGGSSRIFTPQETGTFVVNTRSGNHSDACVVAVSGTGAPGLPNTGAGGSLWSLFLPSALLAAGILGVLVIFAVWNAKLRLRREQVDRKH